MRGIKEERVRTNVLDTQVLATIFSHPPTPPSYSFAFYFPPFDLVGFLDNLRSSQAISFCDNFVSSD